MPSQRARNAGNGQETDRQMDRGGRSQRGESPSSILRRLAHVSCLGYVGIRQKEHGTSVNQGGTADKDDLCSSLTEGIVLSGAFLFLPDRIGRRKRDDLVDGAMAGTQDVLTANNSTIDQKRMQEAYYEIQQY